MPSKRKSGEPELAEGIPGAESETSKTIIRPAAKFNPFTIQPDIATPNPLPMRINPFLMKAQPSTKTIAVENVKDKVKAVVNPFTGNEDKATLPEKSTFIQQPKTIGLGLQRSVKLNSSSMVSPFSSGAFNEQPSSSGHFGTGGEDFDEEDERNTGAPTMAAITKARNLANKIQREVGVGTFSNGFQGGVSFAGFHGTFAGGFEDAEEEYDEAEEEVPAEGMGLYGNGYEHGQYDENDQGEDGQYYENDQGEEGQEEEQYYSANDATQEFVGAPLGFGQTDGMFDAWGLRIAPVLPEYYDDVDEVEEVTVSSSEDEDMDDSFTFANSSADAECPAEAMGFDYNSNAPTTCAGSKRTFETTSNASQKRKKNKKSKKSKSRVNKRAKLSMENSSTPPGSNRCPEELLSRPGMKKYWYNRYELFSKYDEGIKLDLESWFSVTPEKIAEEISNKFSAACSSDAIIIDAFCGCGGNSIQFAKSGRKVISIDIDPVKIENAKHNARIYGVEDNITFIVGDFMALAPALKADAVFLSPPWGGPEYTDCATFDLETMIPMNGITVFELAQTISPNIGYFVPRHVDTDQVLCLAGPGNSVEIQKNYYLGRVKAITAYYGNLVDPSVSETN